MKRQSFTLLLCLFTILSVSAQDRQPIQVAKNETGKILYSDFDAKELSAPFRAGQAISITQEVVVDYQCVPNPGNPSSGNVRLYCDSGTGQLTCLTSTGTNCLTGSGSGIVTSVGLAAPTGFSVTGSPVTGTGTLTWAMPSGWVLGDLLVGNGANSVARLAAPTTPNSVPQVCASTPSSGIGQICAWSTAGLANRDVTGTTNTDTVLATDCTNIITHKESVANAITLPTATTLGVSSCAFLIANNTTGSNTALTITPTTWTINTGATATIQQGDTCRVSVDGATNWKTDCAPSPISAGSGVTLTRSAQGLTIAATGSGGTLTGNGTANTISKFTGTTALGNSTVTDDGTNPTRSPNGSNTATDGNYEEYTVDTGGVTVGLALCATSNVDGAGRPKVLPCSHTATQPGAGFVGIARATIAAAGTVQVCWTVNCSATFDNTSVALNEAILSVTTDGRLHDTAVQTATAGQPNFAVLNANGGIGTNSLISLTGMLAQNPSGGGGGGKSISISVNGTGLAKNTANFNGTTPAAGSNNLNLTWQTSSTGNISSVSAEVPYSSTGSLPGLVIPNSTPTNGNCMTWSVSAGIIKAGDTGGACGGSPGGGIVGYSASAVTLTAATYYFPVVGGGSPSTTETNVDTEAPSAATISNFYASVSAALGGGNSAVFTYRNNATSQSMTCTISGASTTSCNDSTHSFNVVKGDLLTIQVVTTGTIVVTPTLVMTAQFGTTGSNGTVNTGTSGQIGYYAAGGTAISGAGPGTAKQLVQSNGTSGPQFIDFPDVKFIPAANCNNVTAGNGWSIGSGGTVTCRAGTNNLGGYVSITDTSSTFATFQIEIPEDWDTSSNPYIRFQLASTDATNAHTIIPEINVACYKGDGSTTDDVAANGFHSLSTVTLNGNANRFWSSSNVQMNSTDVTGCVAGALMQVTVGRATDTATNAEFYGATITFPRLLVVQAN